MNPYIVSESCSGLRALARQALKGNWKVAVLGVLIVSAISSVPSYILNWLSPYLDMIFTLIITGPLTLGAIALFVSIFRWRNANPGMVFYGFSQFAKSLGIYLLTVLYTFLWMLVGLIPAIIIGSVLVYNSLSQVMYYGMSSYNYAYPDNFGLVILVVMLLAIVGCIPGIIASYRYSMALYIALDNPQIACNDAITASKNIMKGNKKKLFFLHLSFIGWAILASLPSMIWGFSIMGNYMSYFMYSPELAFYYVSGKMWMASLLSFIPGLFLQTYLYAAQVAFYEILVGNLRMQGQEQIPPFNPNPSYPGGPGQPLSGQPQPPYGQGFGQPQPGEPQQPYYGQGFQGYGQPQANGQFGNQPPYGQPPQNEQMDGQVGGSVQYNQSSGSMEYGQTTQPLSGQDTQPGDAQPSQTAPAEDQNINNEGAGNENINADADKGSTEE